MAAKQLYVFKETTARGSLSNYLGRSAIDMNTFLDVQNEKKLEKLDRNKELMQGIPLDEVQILSPIPHPKQDVVYSDQLLCTRGSEAARFHDDAFWRRTSCADLFFQENQSCLGGWREIDGHLDIVDSLDYGSKSWRLSSARMQGM